MPPAWVLYLANITRATKWSREYILWELPLAAGLQIEHAEAVYQGEEMSWAGDGGPVQTMRAQFEAMRSSFDNGRTK